MKHVRFNIKHFDQTVSIRELIKGLNEFNTSSLCRVDFMQMGLGKPDSYRAHPEHLALDCDMESYSQNGVTIQNVIDWLEAAVGSEFTGRKGGEYEMNEDTQVWIAEGHEGIGASIVGAYDAGSSGIVLETALADDDTGYGQFHAKHRDYEVDRDELEKLIENIADMLPYSDVIHKILGEDPDTKELSTVFGEIENAVKSYNERKRGK